MTAMSPGVSEVLADWVEHFRTDPETAGPPPSLEDVLAHLAETNPTVAGVARYMALSQELVDAEQQAEEVVEHQAAEDAPEMARRTEARERLAEAFAELRALRARNDSLAAALGACYRCWGEEASCETCGGAGAPGSRMPQVRLFDMWITPAIRAMRVARSKPSAPTGGVPT